MTTAEAPLLSVIIASVNGPPMIEECLTSLAAQKGSVSAEVIVIDAAGEETVRLIETNFPWVKLLALGGRPTIPELRASGLAHSRGEIIAVIEDHCAADEWWYEEIVKAHRTHPDCVAVGGAVENGSARLVDWAVFFCEYSRYMRPLPRGVVEEIPGNNASYKRRAFEHRNDLEESLRQGFWETTLHAELRARGEHFRLEPSVVVYHRKRFGFRYFLSQRYHYSRYYAGRLVAGTGVSTRLLRGVLSLALPPLLMGRIAAGVVRKRRHIKELVLSSPLWAVFTGAWAIGEMVGWLFGPGESLARVE